MSKNPLKVSHHLSTEDVFTANYGGIYEHSEWVAKAAWKRRDENPFDDANTLYVIMREIVDTATYEQRLTLLKLHPELANKTAIAEDLTKASKSEQSGAGLTSCSPEEYARFAELNTLYNEKFGFPFIVAVAGLDKLAILQRFETRILNRVEAEFTQALTQVHTIARHRLKEFTYHA